MPQRGLRPLRLQLSQELAGVAEHDLRGIPVAEPVIGTHQFRDAHSGLVVDHAGFRFAQDAAPPVAGSSPRATPPRQIDYGELEVLHRLGAGCSSSVFYAHSRVTGAEYAIKRINVFDKAIRDMLLQELQMLFSADCECLIRFYGAHYQEGSVSVVLEYCDKGSLEGVLRHHAGPVPEPVLAGIAFQCLFGLGYLAYERRLHRDIKPSNILLTSDGSVKLSDFGISRSLADSIAAKTFIGSFKYMSPERVSHEPYEMSADIWGLGVCLLEAALGRYPFSGDSSSQIGLILSLLENDAPIPARGEGLSDAFLDFLHHCLARNPQARWCAVELLDSEWLSQQHITTLVEAKEVVRVWLEAGVANAQAGVLGQKGDGGVIVESHAQHHASRPPLSDLEVLAVRAREGK